MEPSKPHSFNWRDAINTLIYVLLVTFCVWVFNCVKNQQLEFSWHLAYVSAISGGVVAIIKNFLKDSTKPKVDFFTLNYKVLLKGLIVSVSGSVIAVLQTSFDAGHLKFNWPLIIIVALGSAVAYLQQKLGVEVKAT